MPYTHFHNWSIHTHHHRPRGGRHYNAIRRRQRPWKAGFFVLAVALAFWVANELDGWTPLSPPCQGRRRRAGAWPRKLPAQHQK